MFTSVSLICWMLLLLQLFFSPEVTAGVHLMEVSLASCPDAHAACTLAWHGSRVCSRLLELALVSHFCLFCFLHVQFCKANSGYCLSQLVCLQHKLTVSRYATIPTLAS